MRKLVFLLLGVCLLQKGLANHNLNIPPNSNPLNLRINNHFKEIVPFNEVKKKQTLKQRLLMKWYRHKMKSTADENQKKKIVNNFGLISAFAAILETTALILAFATSWFGIFIISSIIFCAIALFFGFNSLKKRKKLTDKSGTSKIPALIGIFISCLSILLTIIVFIGFLFFYGN